MKNKILLIGGYHKARALSKSLLDKGFYVTAINNNYDNCLTLAEIEGLQVIQGDGTKAFVLEDAEVADYEMAIALTQRDDDNLVICELCKKLFHVKKTVALVSDPKKMDFFTKMGVDSVVCAINVITNYIEQLAFVEEFTKLTPIGKGGVQMLEITVLNSFPIVSKQLKDIDLPKETIIACLIRGEHTLIPSGDTTIMAQDCMVLVSTTQNQKSALKVITGR